MAAASQASPAEASFFWFCVFEHSLSCRCSMALTGRGNWVGVFFLSDWVVRFGEEDQDTDALSRGRLIEEKEDASLLLRCD